MCRAVRRFQALHGVTHPREAHGNYPTAMSLSALLIANLSYLRDFVPRIRVDFTQRHFGHRLTVSDLSEAVST